MTTSEYTLRIRWEGNAEIEMRTAPFVQSGRLINIMEDVGGIVVMQAGRTTLQFFIRDFADLFQGEHHAQRLLRNAVRHRDFVEIRVMRARLSYHNTAQYARALTAA